MEFTELADYAIPAGALVEWLPCATGPWVPDPRPVSYIHEAHLNRSAAGAGDKSWLGTAFEISGPLDVDAFRVALGRWIDRHEVLRSHTVLEPASGEITRHTVPIGGIDIGVVSHGYDASSQDNFDHLHRLFDDYASPHSWPSYVFATLTPRGGDGPFTVFFAADHSIIDGFSIVLVAHEIAALYREASTGSAANLFPVGSYVDFGAVEREQMADMEAEKAAVEIWRKALGTDGLPQFPLPIGERGTDSQNGLSTWLLDAEQSKAFSSTCAAAGVGYFAGLLGGLAAVGREVAGSDQFEVVTPVHTRSAQEWAGALGWFVGLCPVEFAVGSDCSFGDLATRAAESIASVKPAAAVPFDRIGEHLETPIRPRFVVSYMDVRFVPEAAQWPEWNARALRSKAYTHDVYIWINRTPQGLNLAVRYPGNETANAAVHAYVATLRRTVEEIVAEPDTGTSGSYSSVVFETVS
ncbi:condensation domain-containing protein [Rhodococcus erythropolis]|uniref:Condensation protein n=1 Tax=Rhodococcus erythropolis TaxID=1833 RepID=A0A8I0ZW48_RHOER|nr:condensation domain-containing protein [Rhodococcus erythropolis]MBH5143887.1 condensation protein [Rhodococcus erythropolis]ORI27969.1 condensation protein [Rhodococcus erythropolis]